MGMKFRGPGSSGKARLAVRCTKHRRKKMIETTGAIATQWWSLWKIRKERKGVHGETMRKNTEKLSVTVTGFQQL